MRLKMRLNANSLSMSLWIFLVFSTANLLSSKAQSATLSCVKSQSSPTTHSVRANLSEIDIDSRIESLAKQVLYIRWNQFSDPDQRLQAIHYIEMESQNLQNLIPDLKQRLQQEIRKIRFSEQEKIKRKDETEKEKKDLIEEAIKRANPEYYRKKAIFHEIQPGKFMMGEVGAQVETEITKPFAMMATQVTQMMWARLKIAMGERVLSKINPSKFKTGTDSTTVNIDGRDFVMKPDHPVETVSWNDLMESDGFIEGLNKLSNSNDPKVQELLRELIPGHKKGDIYDLPSTAQWEFVMRNRGLANKKYFDRDDDADVANHAWYGGNSGGLTHAVATKQARMIDGKPFYDLEGNVEEWNKDSSGILLGGKDPLGTSGSFRVLRGGSWNLNADSMRSGNQGFWEPGGRDDFMGFRLVRQSRP